MLVNELMELTEASRPAAEAKRQAQFRLIREHFAERMREVAAEAKASVALPVDRENASDIWRHFEAEGIKVKESCDIANAPFITLVFSWEPPLTQTGNLVK